MVRNPADAYVAEFTKDAPRERIISAGAIMRPLPRSRKGLNGQGVPASAKLAEVAPIVFATETPVAVIGEDGRPVGMVTREAVVEALYGGAKG
jgi:glycine betaine/proline transport system ATP-binding protein